MKLTAHQQLQIRDHIGKIILSKSACDELFDHIVTSLESSSEKESFNMNKVKGMIELSFKEMINTDEEVKKYKLLNNIGGVLMFTVALIVYWLTM
ncbi:MAG: hypothetical protein EOO43_09540, partial [Flavobacterium sp.]